MAWTTPMTAVANEVFTAAQFNINVRDNLLETAVAKATTAGRLLQGGGLNSIVERAVTTAVDNGAAGTTTSTTYTDLTGASAGPAVTLTTGSSALVMISALGSVDVEGQALHVSYAVSGATTIAASDTWGNNMGVTASNNNRWGGCNLHMGLTPGSNTFTMKYKVTSAGPTVTASVARREITVIPL